MSFSEIWDRIKSETTIQNYTELAEIVGTTNQYVSRKKKKDEFPIEWAYKISLKHKVLIEWIIEGTGPKCIQDDRDVIFKDLEEWVKKTSGSGNINWFENQLKAAFPMFEEWRKGKEESKGDTDKLPQSKIA